MIKAALFDLDGVVFNTEPQYTVFWGSQCREFHPELPGLEHEIKGQTLTQILDKLFSGELEDKRELVVARLDEFEKNMDLEYIPGFETFVKDLKSNGIKTAVVTSSNMKKMEVVLEKHPEMNDYFNRILTSEDFKESKPHPDCYLKGAQVFGCQPAECVGFEDSFNGLRAVRAANEFVVGLATTNSREAINEYSDYVTDDYNGLDFSKLNEIVATYR